MANVTRYAVRSIAVSTNLVKQNEIQSITGKIIMFSYYQNSRVFCGIGGACFQEQYQ